MCSSAGNFMRIEWHYDQWIQCVSNPDLESVLESEYRSWFQSSINDKHASKIVQIQQSLEQVQNQKNGTKNICTCTSIISTSLDTRATLSSAFSVNTMSSLSQLDTCTKDTMNKQTVSTRQNQELLTKHIQWFQICWVWVGLGKPAPFFALSSKKHPPTQRDESLWSSCTVLE